MKAKYYPVGDNEKIGFEIVIQVKGEGQVPASSGFAMGICLIQATYSGWAFNVVSELLQTFNPG